MNYEIALQEVNEYISPVKQRDRSPRRDLRSGNSGTTTQGDPCPTPSWRCITSGKRLLARRRRWPTADACGWNLNRGVERVADAVAVLHRAASGRAAFIDHPLHSRFQDLQAALGHTFVMADPLARSVGGHLLGTDAPEIVM